MTKTEYDGIIDSMKRIAGKSKGMPGQIVAKQHACGGWEVWFEPITARDNAS